KWSDLNAEAKTLTISRAFEQTKKHGIRVKQPKTKRGLRTISLDDATIAMLLTEKERLQRVHANVPEGATVDLSLIRLPADAWMFPAQPQPGKDPSLVAKRDPRNFTLRFREHCRKIGREGTRFHVLRGVHATQLLDAGIPLHTTAQRIGDD